MDMFEVALWVAIVGGLVAFALPAYWLVSGWSQDVQQDEMEPLGIFSAPHDAPLLAHSERPTPAP